MITRSYRRSAHAEAVVPWLALSVILLMWWAGARTLTWMQWHMASNGGATGVAPVPTATKSAKAIDDPAPPESTVSAESTHDGPGLTADTSVGGDDIVNLRQRDLMIPVRGIHADALVSSFADARSGHIHQAIDILAPRGTEVVAVENGKVAKLFTSAAGGLTIYEFDAGKKFVYYYAHLDSYAAGLKEGDEVQKGQVIGYVGTTGNAPKNTPHLHFGISKLDPDGRWWGGTALDPYLVLR